MLFVAVTEADLERRDDVIAFAKKRFEMGTPKGMKIIEVYVVAKCRATTWVFEADSIEDIFRWFSPLQPVYTIIDISPVIPIKKLWELYDSELGETVRKVQGDKAKV